MPGFGALGQYALGRQDLPAAYTIAVGLGTFTLTGVAAAKVQNRVLAVAAGAITLSGKAALFDFTLQVTKGTFTLSGVALVLTRDFVLAASPFAVLPRQFVGFAALGSTALGQGNVSSGVTFALTGSGIIAQRALPLAVGVFMVTGTTVTEFVRVRPRIRAFARVGVGGWPVPISANLDFSDSRDSQYAALV